MRRVIVSTYMTMDGRVDELQDWVVPYDDEAAADYHSGLLRGCDALLLGRNTYELFAALWPSRAGELDYIDKLNSMPKYVVSTTLSDLQWANSHLMTGDASDSVAKLKEQPGQDILVYGCHDLTCSLMQQDLIDEYRILVHPVLLGRGRNFFQEGAPRVDLHLVATTVMPSGVAVLTYEPVH